MIVLETGCFGTFGDLVLFYFFPFLAGILVVFFPVLSFLSFFCFLSFAAGARERVGGAVLTFVLLKKNMMENKETV